MNKQKCKQHRISDKIPCVSLVELALQPLKHLLSGLVSNLSPKDGLFPMLDQNVLSNVPFVGTKLCYKTPD